MQKQICKVLITSHSKFRVGNIGFLLLLPGFQTSVKKKKKKKKGSLYENGKKVLRIGDGEKKWRPGENIG